MALSTAPGFIIEELTGLQRSLVLTGWALPRQGVGFGRKNRVKKRWYAGNPQATQQILGPELTSTTIEGTWSSRYLPGQVVVAGFDQPDTAEALVAVFEDIARSAQTLRVQWGTVVRIGVISDFTPTWTRPEDVAFSIEFDWSGEEPGRVRAGPIEVEDDRVRASMVRLDDESVLEPPSVVDAAFLVGETTATTSDRIGDVRRSVVGVLFAIGDLREALGDQIAPARAVVDLVETVRTTSGELITQLVDIPYIYSCVTDDVISVLNTETWRRTMASRASEVRSASLYKAVEVDRIPRPPTQQVVTVRSGQSLRDIAVQVYGDSDGWERIADANNLVSSQVAPGTVLVIPPSTVGA